MGRVIMSNVGVFVSYNHADNKIADAIVQSLAAINADIKVFIDHSGLEAGDEYDEVLSRSIQSSQWFIIVCSGAARLSKNMNWCFYEAGQFRAKLDNEHATADVRNRICCLYDV